MNDQATIETGTALVLPAKASLQTAFEDGTISELIDRIEAEVSTFVPDVSTAKTRAEIKSLAYKVTRSKAPIDEARKALTEGWRSQTDKVNEHWKGVEARLNTLRDKVAKPLKDWEAKDERRRAAHQERLNLFAKDRTAFDMPASDIQSVIDAVEAIDVENGWEEFAPTAVLAKGDALTHHRANLQTATIREDQAKEIAKLRAEKAEREAAEAAKRAAREEQARKDQEAQDRIQQEELERQLKADEAAELERLKTAERAEKVQLATDLMEHITGCSKGQIGQNPQPFELLIYELENKVPPEILKLLEEDQPRVEQHRAATLDVITAKAEIQRKKDEEQRAAEEKQRQEAAADLARREEAERAKREADEKAEAEAKRKADREHTDMLLAEATHAMKEYEIDNLAQAILDGAIPHVQFQV